MEISEDFQLRAGLGEGVVPGRKPTLQSVQRPGKKCSRGESLSKQAQTRARALLWKAKESPQDKKN